MRALLLLTLTACVNAPTSSASANATTRAPDATTADPGCLADADASGTCPTNVEKNVIGTELRPCSTDPLTGFFRDGSCRTGPRDRGVHVVCATMTDAFLDYTKAQGNDLSSPSPIHRFPGLKSGDRWCLCAARWDEARRAGVAPPVHLESTPAAATGIVRMDHLEAHVAP